MAKASAKLKVLGLLVLLGVIYYLLVRLDIWYTSSRAEPAAPPPAEARP